MDDLIHFRKQVLLSSGRSPIFVEPNLRYVFVRHFGRSSAESVQRQSADCQKTTIVVCRSRVKMHVRTHDRSPTLLKVATVENKNTITQQASARVSLKVFPVIVSHSTKKPCLCGSEPHSRVTIRDWPALVFSSHRSLQCERHLCGSDSNCQHRLHWLIRFYSACWRVLLFITANRRLNYISFAAQSTS